MNGVQPFLFAPLQPFRTYPAGTCASSCCQECTNLWFPLCFEWCSSCNSNSCYSAFHAIWWGIQLLGVAKSPDLSAFPPWCGYLFSGLIPMNDILNSKSVVGVKPGDWVSGCSIYSHLVSITFFCSFTN